MLDTKAKAPPEPLPPPNREFRTTFFGRVVETEESLQATHDHWCFMKGYRYALEGVHIPQQGKYI